MEPGGWHMLSTLSTVELYPQEKWNAPCVEHFFLEHSFPFGPYPVTGDSLAGYLNESSFSTLGCHTTPPPSQEF